MKLAIVGWMLFNTCISALNVWSSLRNTKASYRNLQLAQENTRNAQAVLREHKASISLNEEVMAIVRRLGAL